LGIFEYFSWFKIISRFFLRLYSHWKLIWKINIPKLGRARGPDTPPPGLVAGSQSLSVAGPRSRCPWRTRLRRLQALALACAPRPAVCRTRIKGGSQVPLRPLLNPTGGSPYLGPHRHSLETRAAAATANTIRRGRRLQEQVGDTHYVKTLNRSRSI
jgi:hypothetical protein